MQKKPDVLFVAVPVKMVDAAGVEGARPADDAVHFISLLQKELAQIGAVLAGDSGNQGFFHGVTFSRMLYGLNIQARRSFYNPPRGLFANFIESVFGEGD